MEQKKENIEIIKAEKKEEIYEDGERGETKYK